MEARTLIYYGTIAQSQIDNYETDTQGIHYVPYDFKFIWGTPFALRFDLTAGAGTIIVVPNEFYGFEKRTGAGDGISDFSDTFRLSGLTIEDANGNPVPGATFSSQSGTLYTQQGVVITPEPATALLLLPGIVIAWIGRRRLQCSKRILGT